VDAPAEIRSSIPPKKREGPLDRIFKTLIQKDEDEAALEILRRSKDSNIAAVRRCLDAFLSFAPTILSLFLFPTLYPEAECRRLHSSLESAKRIRLSQSSNLYQSMGQKANSIDRFTNSSIKSIKISLAALKRSIASSKTHTARFLWL
jgi:hypothetical protein